MITALFNGVSGLQNHMTRMNTIGNNIANVNTAGFKRNRVTFQDMLYQTIQGATSPESGTGGTNPFQVGLGMVTRTIDTIFTQGSLEMTGRPTDLAIRGNGFFVVNDGQRQLFTRSGAFSFNANGALVDAGTGFIVQGWMGDANGRVNATGSLSNIILPAGQQVPPRATTTVGLAGNLNADTLTQTRVQTADFPFTTGGVPADAATALDALDQVQTPLAAGDTLLLTGTNPDGTPVSATYTYQTGDTLQALLDAVNAAFSGVTAAVDGEGNLVVTDDEAGTSQSSLSLSMGSGATGALTLPQLRETAAGSGSERTSIEVFDSLGNTHTLSLTFTRAAGTTWTWEAAVDGQASILGGNTGTVTFNPDGSVRNFTYDDGSAFRFDPGNGASPLSILLDAGTGFTGLTQFGADSSLHVQSQDGYGRGTLDSLVINEAGVVTGRFSNGTTRDLAQIALANFTNPDGLEKAGSNLFAATSNSNLPVIGAAGSDFGAAISSNHLEMSNVDLAQEFTDMIITQRGFQANARVITTSDELLRDMITLKQ
jgi:flagellar hook protein FlgE